MSSIGRGRHVAWVLGVALLWLGVGPASAQIPDEFTNLTVLPKDIGKRQIVAIMRNFASSLGTRCHHCHVGEDPNSLKGSDFASDAKETKQVARAMMKMTSEINDRLMPTIGRESPLRVRCVTCHAGLDKPQMDRVVATLRRR